MIQSYQDLKVWQKSIDLVLLVYKVTSEFPKLETYVLSSQSRRAAISVPSNIAEGYCRKGKTIGGIVEVRKMLNALIRGVKESD